MVVALYTTLHWRCSPQHNSYLVLPFIRIRHPFISVHFQSFYITWTFSTKRQVCIYRKIRPSKHQITEQSPKLVLSTLSIFKKEKKSLQYTSLPELTLLDVKLRTSPVLEMVRMWMWGTAPRERQYGTLPRPPGARACTLRSTSTNVYRLRGHTALWGGLWLFGKGQRETQQRKVSPPGPVSGALQRVNPVYHLWTNNGASSAGWRPISAAVRP